MNHSSMWGLRPKIIAAFFLLSIIPVFFAGILIIWQNYNTRLQNVALFQKELSARVLLEVNTYFSTTEHLIEDVNRYQNFTTLSESKKRDTLYLLLAHRKYFTSVAYLSKKEGMMIRVSNKSLTQAPKKEELFNDDAYTIPAQNGTFYYSKIYNDVEVDEPLITISYPINDRSTGENLGVIIASVRLKPVWELFAELRLSEGEDIYLTDSKRRIVAHKNPSVVLASTLSPIVHDGFQRDILGQEVYSHTEDLFLGEQQFELITNTTYDAIIAPYLNQAVIIAAIIVILILAIYLLFLYISNTILKPIKKIGEALKDFKIEEPQELLPFHNHNEIGELADQFNTMAVELKQIHSRLEASKELLEVEVQKRTHELIEANSKLKELDTLKSMFIASMSHEFRTPLNSIIGFTGIILQGLTGEINEKQKEHLNRVKQAGQHLLSLISDVIDISKIEAGRIEAVVTTFSLKELLIEAKGEIEVVANPKGLCVEIEMGKDILIQSDRRRLYQCLLNYLSNAVKFTDKSGTIVIRIEEEEKEVKISVVDNGIGIAKEDQSKLFEAFERFESHLKVKAGGTGLGLYLTKKISEELLYGTVFVESTQGEGSTFGLCIPKNINLFLCQAQDDETN